MSFSVLPGRSENPRLFLCVYFYVGDISTHLTGTSPHDGTVHGIFSLLSGFPASWWPSTADKKYLAQDFSTEVTGYNVNFLMSQFGIWSQRYEKTVSVFISVRCRSAWYAGDAVLTGIYPFIGCDQSRIDQSRQPIMCCLDLTTAIQARVSSCIARWGSLEARVLGENGRVAD